MTVLGVTKVKKQDSRLCPKCGFKKQKIVASFKSEKTGKFKNNIKVCGFCYEEENEVKIVPKTRAEKGKGTNKKKERERKRRWEKDKYFKDCLGGCGKKCWHKKGTTSGYCVNCAIIGTRGHEWNTALI